MYALASKILGVSATEGSTAPFRFFSPVYLSYRTCFRILRSSWRDELGEAFRRRVLATRASSSSSSGSSGGGGGSSLGKA
ncbi:hypothetical protein K0M31_013524 [Melipona bicolor]|uniref:Uncharacterized protein n=1 Tax=Melipona bicolor TaxID=60889 RepID=A0AA40FHT6_9HYME|nr:hypothetical protein K0M31_013524 [Melipona bicolor]